MHISPINFYGNPSGYKQLIIPSAPHNKYLNYEHYTIESVTEEIKHFKKMYDANKDNRAAKMLIGAYEDILKELKTAARK